jgi:3-oxoacyl-[acyl-carrier protein] reductase
MISIVGAAAFRSLLETTAEIWDQQMQLNLRYFFLIAKEVANVMIRRGTGGRIVGIASVDGQRASADARRLRGRESRLISTVRTMAVEWAPHNISVNAIAPGHIVTPRLFDTPQRASRVTPTACSRAPPRHNG